MGRGRQSSSGTANRFVAVVGTRRGLGPLESARRRARERQEVESRHRARANALGIAQARLRDAHVERAHLRDDIALIQRTLLTSTSPMIRQQLNLAHARKRVDLEDNEDRIGAAEDELEALDIERSP
jgi:hypothetical protein